MKKSLTKLLPLFLGAFVLTMVLTDSSSPDLVGSSEKIESIDLEPNYKLAEAKDIIVKGKGGLYPGPDVLRSMMFTRAHSPSPNPKFIGEVIENEDLSKFDQ